MTYYQIDEATARVAHNMTYSRDYIPGEATQDYRNQVDKAAQLVEDQKKQVSPFYHDKLDSLLESYSRKLAQWINASNRNGASCPSILTSGAGNFPVRKKEKQNARADALWQEYQEIESILSRIRSVGTGPIDFADPNAREMLVERLEAEKRTHAKHLEANKFYRKNKTLEGCPGITDKEMEWLTRPGVFAHGDGSPIALYRQPYPAYALQGETAAIKRYEARLAEYDRRHEQAQNPDQGKQVEGCKIVRNADQNRLQLIFDEKPDEDMRAKLKSHGFRWSPRNGAWQRQLTENAEIAVKQIFGEV